MSTGQYSLLIVDDNLHIRSYLKTVLSAGNYHVLEATDGAAAVTMLREHHVDLVLLDMEMPVLPGLEALKQLRGFWQGPVIMVSAIQAVSSKVDALDKGASDYIEKPFNETELLARIRANLRRSPDQKRVIWGGRSRTRPLDRDGHTRWQTDTAFTHGSDPDDGTGAPERSHCAVN